MKTIILQCRIRVPVIASLLATLSVFAACAGDGETDAAADEDVFTEDGEPPLSGPDGKADGFGEDVPAYGALSGDADFTGDLQVMFAPSEPVVTLELKWIDWVRDARKADPNDYVEGENPYTIDYAVYTLRNQQIVDHLADAEDDGVDVQILIESDQLGKDRAYNTIDEFMAFRGHEVVLSHKDLTDESRETADLIGIKHSGLMHTKIRIFSTPDDRVVLSGSFNAGSYAPFNDENIHLIRSPYLAERYAALFEALRYGGRAPNAWDDDEPVNLLFSRPSSGLRPGTRIFNWLEEEQELILLMVYSLRNITAVDHGERTLVDILADKVAAGVPVYAITDKKQSDQYSNDIEDLLRGVGVPTYEALNESQVFCAMHHKVAVLGRTRMRVISGSANWTKGGLGARNAISRNQETALFIDSSRLDDNLTGRRYLAEWLAVLERYAPQNAERGDPGPDYATIRDRLLDLSDWPDQPVRFTVLAAHTEDPAEQIRVLGDHALLGDWGATDAGHRLEAGMIDQTSWASPEPLDLPLGLDFEWKFGAYLPSTEALRWEQGGNRPGRAAAAYFRPEQVLELQGYWR